MVQRKHDDIVVGAHLALNDSHDRAALVGAVVDRHHGSIAAFVEAERRFGSRLVLELESRLFLDVDPMDSLAVFTEDWFVTLRLAYFF